MRADTPQTALGAPRRYQRGAHIPPFSFTDWSTLALTSQDWVRDAKAVGVHLSCLLAPGSMYEEYAPPGSQDVIYAATTFHWCETGGQVCAP